MIKQNILYSFKRSITSKQQINVKIRICYPEKQRNHCYEILCFKNEAVGTWKKDDSLPVFQRK